MTDRTEARRTRLLEVVREAGGKPLGIGEIMQRAKLHPGERTEVKRVLRDLVRDAALVRDGKRWSVPGARPAPAPAGKLATPRAGRGKGGRGGLLATLKKHRDGFGFAARLDRQGDDVFVPPDEAAKALDGDLVRLEIVPARGGRTMGRVLEVVERRRRLLLGTYHARGKSSFVVPSDPQLEGAVPVPETAAAKDGDVVKVALDPDAAGLRGEVLETIGRPGEPRVEVLKVAYAKGFADLFPEPVVQASEAVPDHVRAEDRRDRKDLTSLPLVTIDGEDARDFDDAVHVERIPSKKGAPRWRLVVAIADVAHYVKAGEPLDVEAARRGTSVYFPMQVLPMLPERLSNGICSLNPDVERLCMVADMVIDGRGETQSAEVYQAVMRSHARCTYTEVARVLDGEHVPHREAFRERFEVMAELQERLTAMRGRRGAIDFDLPESKIVLDPDGRVVGIERRPRNRAHRIVEEFMLAANEAVARWFGTRELPTVYRVHGVPDEEKLASFLALAALHGFEVPEPPVAPTALNALLERLKGHGQQRALNQLLLRAMMQAVYATENIGHYGLAAEHYLHFTSPIRRYPDLLVHRLLKEEWAIRQGRSVKRTPEPALAELAALSSDRERAAMEAEREIAAFYAALFMKDKVGERFDGLIAAVAEPGVFVELRPFFVEGMVRAEELGAEVRLDPVQHALVDAASGRAYRVGDALHVEILSVSLLRRRIELAPVNAAGEVRARQEPGAWPEAPRGRRGETPPGGKPRRLADALADRRKGTKQPARHGKAERGPPSSGKQPGGGKSQRRGDGHREQGRGKKRRR
ncbi:MAG: ribonuclease R [Anaeromyxobacter sp.]